MSNQVPNYIKLLEVKRQTTLSKSTVYAQIKAGIFPAPAHLGSRRVAWDQNSINAYLNGTFKKAGV